MCVCVCVCVLVTAVLVKTTAAEQWPTSATTFQGQKVMFHCSDPDAKWIKNDIKVFESPDVFYSTDKNKYNVVDKYHLVINDVQESDAGTYMCEAPSRLELLPADLVVIGNMQVKFLCTSQFKLNVE